MLKNIFDYIQTAVKELKSNKMRSFLTVLGIIIGVFSIISVITIGRGAKVLVIKEIEKVGSNLVWVVPKTSSDVGEIKREVEYLKLADAKLIMSEVAQVKNIAPSTSFSALVNSPYKAMQTNITGTDYNLGQIRNIKLQAGRFLSLFDTKARYSVCVLGAKVKQKLFASKQAVGQNIRIKGESFLVVGVLEKESLGLFTLSFGGSDDDKIYVPITAVSALTGSQDIGMLNVQVQNSKAVKLLEQKIKQVLFKQHGSKGEFEVISFDQMVNTIQVVGNILSAVLGSIAFISLLVGGIGIMNIMLASVQQRVREVGIRKSVGAKEKDILLQFLVEAMVLSTAGGIGGIGLGILAAMVLSLAINLPLLLSFSTLIWPFVFSSLVGIVFGLYPAFKAAQLSPMEALRYE